MPYASFPGKAASHKGNSNVISHNQCMVVTTKTLRLQLLAEVFPQIITKS
jgi:hypothetical protein